MSVELKDTFLQLVRLGAGADANAVSNSMYFDQLSINQDSSSFDWEELQNLAAEQGLSAIVLDGIERLPDSARPPKVALLQWIGEVLQQEAQQASQRKTAMEMAQLFHDNGIRTYVLKGAVVAECYPKPGHRVSVDLDCFLSETVQGSRFKVQDDGCQGHFDAWERGDELIRAKGYEVETVFYKNSSFFLPDLMVENHRFLTPFRGNKRLKSLERLLQRLINQNENDPSTSSGQVNVGSPDGSKLEENFTQNLSNSQLTTDSKLSTLNSELDKFEGTELWRPPVMVSALFLIEHAYSHFLHEGLTWKHVLDWVMFSKKHQEEIDWKEFDARIDEFGFRKFYDVFNGIGQDAFGNDSSRIRELENSNSNSKLKSLMLADIWAPLDLHESVRGLKGKLALVGNTWRARWKYRYFTDMNWIEALWIQVKGFLFEKEPTLY